MIEANWHHFISSKNCSHILLEGLIPTQTYWLRIRGVGCNGLGAWSSLLSIIVV